MKNQELWQKILEFDFDQPWAEYGFSTRLADENYWTVDFTNKAILEYKKFMYLAATSEWMVSPSAIVDVVWHQHLIFTQSYQEFCSLIGKQIQHIPSTHNREDAIRFAKAKERTQQYYGEEFGDQPQVIWGYEDMFSSLRIAKAKYKLRSFIIVGILSMMLLAVPFYFLLKPLYLQIHNPYFVEGYLILSVILFGVLNVYSERRLRSITDKFDPDSFIYHLHPYEVIYLKDESSQKVVHAAMNELVLSSAVSFNPDMSYHEIHPELAQTELQKQVMEVIKHQKTKFYHEAFRQLIRKPLIRKYGYCMSAFVKYFNKSKDFQQVFILNFCIIAIWVLLGFTRIMTGIMREKMVVQIFIVTILFAVAAGFYLKRLTRKVAKKTIPDIYRKLYTPANQKTAAWEWQYCYGSDAALSPLLVASVVYVDQKHAGSFDGGSTCGTSGGSCGSSCSSCGGCGN